MSRFCCLSSLVLSDEFLVGLLDATWSFSVSCLGPAFKAGKFCWAPQVIAVLRVFLQNGFFFFLLEEWETSQRFGELAAAWVFRTVVLGDWRFLAGDFVVF